MLKVGRVVVKEYGQVLSWGGDHLGSGSEGFVIVLGLHRVVGVFLDLKCVESVCRRRESGGLHVCELVGEDSADGVSTSCGRYMKRV